MIAAPWPLALALVLAEPADAQVTVAARDCGALDADEVARLLRIELLAVTQEIRSGPPLAVELHCAAPTMAISVSDPLTGKRLARDVPLPADEAGRERVVALAIAQLFAASWLELLLPSEPASEPPTKPAQPKRREPEPAAVEAARTLARARVQTRPRSIAVGFAGIVRGRALEGTPVLTGGGEIDVRGWFGGAAVVFRVGVEAGSAHRAQGDVRTLAVLGGLGAAGRLPVGGRWDLGALALVGGGVVRLHGAPSQAGVPADTVAAITGQITLGAGPRVRLGIVVLELDAELGGMLREPQGIVAGEKPVTLGGLWAGGALRVVIETPLPRERRARR